MRSCSVSADEDRFDVAAFGSYGGDPTVSCPPSHAPTHVETMSLLDELFSSPPVTVSSLSDLADDAPVKVGDAARTGLPLEVHAAAPLPRYSIEVSVGPDSTGRGMASSLSPKQLEEVVPVFQGIFNDDVPRWYEACAILRSLSPRSPIGNAPKFIPSDVAGELSMKSFFQSDHTAKSHCELVSIAPFLEFEQTFQHISVFPVLKISPLASTLRQCVQDWVESHGGVRAVLLNSTLLLDLQTLLENVNEAFVASVATSPQSASEALLLSSLTDICRYCVQLACTCIPYGDHPVSATTMQAVMQHNSTVISHVVEELQNHEKILHLLVVARSTAYHRCSEDVQASVSPLIAELLSLLDTFSSSSTMQLDKKKGLDKRCRLSGLRLPSSCPSEVIDAFVYRYWKETTRGPTPT
ncbi:hypothetical protein TraAM80_07864 [Trypanosoma rangeli]|uniref:Uncharacterized protein n=1 Tax=Trypanosoma rangeli TaxID=5698 RepID=A0A3R7N4H9_TRYRA|nr:uncharacterized protein TraAM80_07864 [Trypanosoma rangeli]RNE99999.1 hypothetical protein TraAM80_07864 [Trypanosoma rangeli]|eukprot:RNE99999.1 hypothetical protein TraAM80_07864 [Trypanosoma rangeli]